MEATQSPAEHRVILHNTSWETYERLLKERGERRAPRLAYDRGELEIMSPSLDKFPIYARLGVYEVWRYDGDQASIFVLEDGEYAEAGESSALPSLTSDLLTRFIEESASLGSTDWLRRVREWARQNTGPSV